MNYKLHQISKLILILVAIFIADYAFSQNKEVALESLKIREGIHYIANKTIPFSGTAITKYATGNLSLKSTFRNGIQHGLETSWYPSGQLKHEIIYISGRPQTLNSKWYEDKPKKQNRFILCNESEALSGFCDKKNKDQPSTFKLCIDSEQCNGS